MSRQVIVSVSHPGGANELSCDNLVIVAFTGQDTGWKALAYKVWQCMPSRRLMMHAAKALLSHLAEDTSDAYGKAASRALEQVHRKST